MKELYTQQFYEGQQKSSLDSAKVTIPILINHFRPTSVLDVGCGVGTWLSQFIEAGIKDCLGLDGPWISGKKLLISEENFRIVDLATPPKLHRRFSMAVSLEVAEHLPVACADSFVDFLISAAPVVAFSAAVPGQGGTGHLNEQWQDYWCHLFEERGFIPVDIVRKAIWNNPKVCWWYAQNLILYVDAEYAQEHHIQRVSGAPLNLVHPRFLHEALVPHNLRPGSVFKALPHIIKGKAKRLLLGQGSR